MSKSISPPVSRWTFNLTILLASLIVCILTACVGWLLIRSSIQEQKLSSLESKLDKITTRLNELERKQLDKKIVKEKSSLERREVISSGTVSFDNLIKNLRGSPGPAGPQGPAGKDGRDGRDAVNLNAVDRHINTSVTNAVRVEMDKVRLAAKDIPAVSGSVYVRWGRDVCPSHSALLYKGRAGGTFWYKSGGSARHICLPDDPEYKNYSSSPIHGKIAGVEYKNYDNLRHHNAPCADCQSSNRPQRIMIPAKVRCPDSSWTVEYNGFLMGEATTWDDHRRTEYVCVDGGSTMVVGQADSTNGAVWYHQAIDCDTLGNCPPYYADRQLNCVVCSK